MTPENFKKAYTNVYWVTFDGGKEGCFDCGPDEDPLAIAREFGALRAIDSLPYPAEPILRRRPDVEHPCPPFCYSPRQCKGRTSCPKSYACSE